MSTTVPSPFGKHSTKRKPTATAITLEGRTRLPQRVQDLIIELGTSIASIQQAPGISDALNTSIRNFAAVDGIAQNSTNNLEKLAKQLDRIDGQTEGIEQGLDKLNDVLDQVNCLEQSAYCTNSATPTLVITNCGQPKKVEAASPKQ